MGNNGSQRAYNVDQARAIVMGPAGQWDSRLPRPWLVWLEYTGVTHQIVIGNELDRECATALFTALNSSCDNKTLMVASSGSFYFV